MDVILLNIKELVNNFLFTVGGGKIKNVDI